MLALIEPPPELEVVAAFARVAVLLILGLRDGLVTSFHKLSLSPELDVAVVCCFSIFELAESKFLIQLTNYAGRPSLIK